MPDLAQEELVGLDEPLSALSSFESQVPCGPDEPLSALSSFESQVPWGPTTAAHHQCWGSALSGDGSRCSPGFVAGRGHFKNHFCASCRTFGFSLPTARLRALNSTQHAEFDNAGGKTPWSDGPDKGAETYRFRLINQTQKCVGPRVIILHPHADSPASSFAALPTRWVDANGLVHVIVSKGTLTPVDADAYPSGPSGIATCGAGPSASVANATIDNGDNGHSHATKRSRASPTQSDLSSESFGVASASQDSTTITTTALQELHERLANLLVEATSRPVGEQESEGIDDAQRAAFASLIAPLKVSTSLLKREPHTRGGAAEGGSTHRDLSTADDGPPGLGGHASPTPSAEAIARLHARMFGKLDAENIGPEGGGALSIAGLGLGDAEFVALAHVLLTPGRRQVTNLRKLDLSSNFLTAASAPLMASLLVHATALEELDVGGMQWGDRGFALIAEALRSAGMGRMRMLGLRGIGLSSDGAHEVVRLFAATSTTTLETLSLECNRLPDEMLVMLSGQLLLLPPAAAPPLRVLSLGNAHGGNAISDRGVLALSEALREGRLSALERLGLAYNRIGDEGALALADAINGPSSTRPTPKLMFLAISGNFLSDDGVDALRKCANACDYCLLSQPQFH